jgi:hypothetical protein
LVYRSCEEGVERISELRMCVKVTMLP